MLTVLLLLAGCNLFPDEDNGGVATFVEYAETICEIYNECLIERGFDPGDCTEGSLEFDCDYNPDAAAACLGALESPCDVEFLGEFDPCNEVCAG
jgi:hypothetical protein